jgi:circadian clock protein KaiB
MANPGIEGLAQADDESVHVTGPVEAQPYLLRLYVTGKAPHSLRAIASVKEVCEQYLSGRYHLQVIDIYQQPALAEADQIIVAPTLVKKSPGPLRKVIGDLSDRERILQVLDLCPDPEDG